MNSFVRTHLGYESCNTLSRSLTHVHNEINFLEQRSYYSHFTVYAYTVEWIIDSLIRKVAFGTYGKWYYVIDYCETHSSTPRWDEVTLVKVYDNPRDAWKYVWNRAMDDPLHSRFLTTIKKMRLIAPLSLKEHIAMWLKERHKARSINPALIRNNTFAP